MHQMVPKMYWLDKRKKEERMARNFGRGSVMIWATIDAKDKRPICFISTKK